MVEPTSRDVRGPRRDPGEPIRIESGSTGGVDHGDDQGAGGSAQMAELQAQHERARPSLVSPGSDDPVDVGGRWARSRGPGIPDTVRAQPSFASAAGRAGGRAEDGS